MSTENQDSTIQILTLIFAGISLILSTLKQYLNTKKQTDLEQHIMSKIASEIHNLQAKIGIPLPKQNVGTIVIPAELDATPMP